MLCAAIAAADNAVVVEPPVALVLLLLLSVESYIPLPRFVLLLLFVALAGEFVFEPARGGIPDDAVVGVVDPLPFPLLLKNGNADW